MAAALAADDLARISSSRQGGNTSKRSWGSTSVRELWNAPDVFEKSARHHIMGDDEEELRWAAIERLPTFKQQLTVPKINPKLFKCFGTFISGKQFQSELMVVGDGEMAVMKKVVNMVGDGDKKRRKQNLDSFIMSMWHSSVLIFTLCNFFFFYLPHRHGLTILQAAVRRSAYLSKKTISGISETWAKPKINISNICHVRFNLPFGFE